MPTNDTQPMEPPGDQRDQQTGASTWVCDYILEYQLASLRPTEAVDFGAGGGKNGRIVRNVLVAANS
jgi:hypothetical protein